MSAQDWNYNLQNEMLSTIKEWQDVAKKLEQENSEFKLRINELELKLTALGNLAVANWDASTVQEVDTVVEPHKTTYDDYLRTLFRTNPEKIKKLEQENTDLRAALNTALAIEFIDDTTIVELIKRLINIKEEYNKNDLQRSN